MKAKISVTRKRYFLSSALAVAALAASGTALAQAAPAAAPADAGTPGAGAQTSGQGAGLEQVVVTAERRESTVQHTAATVDVVTSATLQRQNIVQVQDLNSVSLNTQFAPEAYVLQITIRGITTYSDPRADPAVSLSFNGLFYDRPVPIGFGFLDVARVETLEGPQGTLYGRNSAAGAVNVITNQPSQQFGGMLQASGGNYGYNDFTGVLNVPVDNDLAFRFAYDRDRRNGYISNYYDDIQTDTGRISARWTPTDKLTVYAEANYEAVGGHGSYSEAYPCPGATPFTDFMPPACAALPLGGYPPKNSHVNSYVNADQIHIDYDLGFATFTSITGYVVTHLGLNTPNGTYFQANVAQTNNDWSEEIRLAGHDSASHQGGLAWQVGAYFFDSTGGEILTDTVYFPPLAPALNARTFYNAIPQNSEAGYAQITYGITDQLRITGGVRYTNDYKGLSVADYNDYFGIETNHATSSYTAGKFTYKGGLEYDLTPRNMLYATVSTGYTAGGPNGGNPSVAVLPDYVPANFLPETDTSYEVGSKNRFFDNRLQLNADVYYFDFSNYQYLYPGYLQGSPTYGLQIENAATATNYGVEVSGEFALTPDDLFTAGVSYTHGTFGTITLNTLTLPAQKPELIVVPAGSPLTNEPQWVGLLGYDHTWRLPNDDSLVFSVNSKLSSSYLLVVGSTDPSDSQKGYTMTDASLAYNFGQDKYTIRLWAKNLENSVVNVYGQGLAFHQYGVSPPRMYGGTVTVKF